MIYFDPERALKDRAWLLRSLDAADQALLHRELQEDPSFAWHLGDLLRRPDALRAIGESALMAAANELDPSQFPESAGTWKALRRDVRAIPVAFMSEADRFVRSLSTAEKLAWLDELRVGRLPIMLGDAGPGMSDLGDILGTVLGSVIDGAFTLGSGYLQTNILADLQEEIAEMKIGAEERVAAQKLAAEKEVAEKRLAQEAEVAKYQIDAQAITTLEVAKQQMAPEIISAQTELPKWLIPAGLGAVVLVILMFLAFKGKG